MKYTKSHWHTVPSDLTLGIAKHCCDFEQAPLVTFQTLLTQLEIAFLTQAVVGPKVPKVKIEGRMGIIIPTCVTRIWNLDGLEESVEFLRLLTVFQERGSIQCGSRRGLNQWRCNPNKSNNQGEIHGNSSVGRNVSWKERLEVAEGGLKRMERWAPGSKSFGMNNLDLKTRKLKLSRNLRATGTLSHQCTLYKKNKRKKVTMVVRADTSQSKIQPLNHCSFLKMEIIGRIIPAAVWERSHPKCASTPTSLVVATHCLSTPIVKMVSFSTPIRWYALLRIFLWNLPYFEINLSWMRYSNFGCCVDEMVDLCGWLLIYLCFFLYLIDQEKKKWRPQQEGPWPRHLHALLQLLALRWKGQGYQALHSEEHGWECCRSGYQRS